MINYVTTKTPLRVSFVGGGTDFYKHYSVHGGSVVSTAINKYIYVTVKRHSNLFNEKYRLNYSDTEIAQGTKYIKNEITKACLEYMKINFSVYISTISDIPTSSGLGSSSAFTVGLLHALHTILGNKISKQELALQACKIELDILKKPIGVQDQFAVSYGSINQINFKKKSIKVNKIKLNKNNLNLLSKQMFLVWTGQTRDSYKILRDQKKNIKIKTLQLNKMTSLASKFAKSIRMKKINLDTISDILNLNWVMKETLSKNITTKRLSKIYKKIKKSKADGIKLLGAGGGGFFLTVVKKKNQEFFKKNIKSLKIVNFKFSNNGTKVIYKDETI